MVMNPGMGGLTQMQLIQMMLGDPNAATTLASMAPPPAMPAGGAPNTPLGGLGAMIAPQSAPIPMPRPQLPAQASPVAQEALVAGGVNQPQTAQGEGVGQNQGQPEDPTKTAVQKTVDALAGVQAPAEKKPPMPSTAAPSTGAQINPQMIALMLQMLGGQGAPTQTPPPLGALIGGR